jgi:hypothetical protein
MVSTLFGESFLGTGLAILLGEVFISEHLMDLTVLAVTKIHAEPGSVGVRVLAALHVLNIVSRRLVVNLFLIFRVFQPCQKP